MSVITTRIRRMGEGNIFSLFDSPHPGGYPSPGFLPRSLVSGSFWGYPSPGFFPGFLGIPDLTGVLPCQDCPPLLDRLHCGWYASCGFPQGDFLVWENFVRWMIDFKYYPSSPPSRFLFNFEIKAKLVWSQRTALQI